MAKVPIASIESHFSELTDPRRDDSRTRHKLMDILVIAICAIICGADNWVAVESFGHAKYNWLSRFLQLPHGIPSHDTFSRVFGLIDSTQFEHCFTMNTYRRLIGVRTNMVDGQRLIYRAAKQAASERTCH